jgi:2-(1,2-epoxy-1,2-dihydrophenyl)acetyl-CoA isomerase
MEEAVTTYETVKYDLEDDVVTITLNRPDRLNALSVQLLADVSAAIDTAIAAGARALLLTGEGRAFSAGLDLVDASRRRKTERLLDTYYNPFIRKLTALSIPIVTAINGAAIGGGCALALAGDISIAAPSAYLQSAFVNLGLVPDTGATWLIARGAGRAKAMEMMLLGDRVQASEALNLGLITRVVDDAALLAEARAVALRLAKGPSVALGLIRKQVSSALALSFEEMLVVESQNQDKASVTADVQESLTAFMERRPPKFTGR